MWLNFMVNVEVNIPYMDGTGKGDESSTSSRGGDLGTSMLFLVILFVSLFFFGVNGG